jgi:D-alanyl-D-alanine carboxypeptidase (penicillin-binding protein 5/6)
MTAIVACEHIEDMQDTFTITKEIRYPLDNAEASMAYFKMDEPIYMLDLIYGALLPSGADATAAIAIAVAGSEEAFVELMNQKAAELGCTSTHFMNTTGLHHDDHYSTAKDIATIMAYALQNPFLKKVMCTASYKSISPVENDDNMLRATWIKTLNSVPGDYSFFEGAKTGYEDLAEHCMVSLIKDEAGKEYVVVTAKTSERNNIFLDLKTIYNSYVAQ